MPQERRHHRPIPREAAFFDEYVDGADPALVTEAADRAAVLLVRGAQTSADAGVAERLVHLADEEGIEAIADVWSHAGAETVAGCLWRLYSLRSWVYADPIAASRQFDAGRRLDDFAQVVAGVADPPGPDELRRLVDEVLRGIATAEFADVLFRAAAFAQVVAAGRAALHEVPVADVRRMLGTAEQLEAAGHLELAGRLG